MHVSALDKLLWAVTFSADAALLLVLLLRGRWRQFPVFTVWIAFLAARTVALFLIFADGPPHLYARVYWLAVWPDFLLQLGVAIEIARIVLRPTGTWVRDARLQFWTAGLAGAALAALFAWWVTPAAHSALAVWRLRGNLFTSLVICEVFVAMSTTASRLGLGWRNHVMALGQGLTAWSALTLITDSLQALLGAHHDYTGLANIRSASYLAAALWITVQLWAPEPERHPISPDLHDYILELHRRVEYDLRRLDAK